MSTSLSESSVAESHLPSPPKNARKDSNLHREGITLSKDAIATNARHSAICGRRPSRG
jgi:hypothetical protein